MKDISQTVKAQELLAQLDAARSRLDRATDLMQWGINLRQQLWWGLGLDNMVTEVGAFVRDSRAFRRERNHGR